MPYEQFVYNLSSKARSETLWGEKYLVAEGVILREGVLNGSEGALFYPAHEIQKTYQDWNAVPQLLKHPEKNGGPPSGRTPQVLENQGIGFVFNARIDDNNRLHVEHWFHENRTRNLHPKLLDRLQKGEKIEVSTGLFTDNEPAENNAAHNGTSYTYVARNYRPDHLAVLPDNIGACSVQDGCGVFNERAPVVNSISVPNLNRAAKPKTKGNPMIRNTLFQKLCGAPQASVREDDKVVKNEASFDDIRENISKALKARYGYDDTDPYPAGPVSPLPCWVVDVFDDHFIYQYGAQLYSLGYDADMDTGEVELSSDPPQKVKRQENYIPVGNYKRSILKATENEVDCGQVEDARGILEDAGATEDQIDEALADLEGECVENANCGGPGDLGCDSDTPCAECAKKGKKKKIQDKGVEDYADQTDPQTFLTPEINQRAPVGNCAADKKCAKCAAKAKSLKDQSVETDDGTYMQPMMKNLFGADESRNLQLVSG